MTFDAMFELIKKMFADLIMHKTIKLNAIS